MRYFEKQLFNFGKHMRWDDLRAFQATAKMGSFTAAATLLGVSVATLTRKVNRIESQLSLVLLRRGPSGVTLTLDGARILPHVENGHSHLAQVSRVALAIRKGQLRDPVRISTTEPIVADILAPNVHFFTDHHPDIQLDLRVSTAVTNLNKSEADLAIRLSRPKEPSLLARQIGEIRFSLYGLPAFSNQAQASGIYDLPFVGFNDAYGDIQEHAWLRNTDVENQVRLFSSSSRAIFNSVIAGAGVGLLPDFLARRAKELIKIPAPDLPKRDLWLVFHKDLKAQPTIVQVREWIVNTCHRTLN